MTSYSDAELEAMDSAKLWELRNKHSTDRAFQNRIAPYEHKDFARQATKDNPLMAIPIGIAAPLYTAKKALFNTGARSDASLEEISKAYEGIYEGVLAAFAGQ